MQSAGAAAPPQRDGVGTGLWVQVPVVPPVLTLPLTHRRAVPGGREGAALPAPRLRRQEEGGQGRSRTGQRRLPASALWASGGSGHTALGARLCPTPLGIAGAGAGSCGLALAPRCRQNRSVELAGRQPRGAEQPALCRSREASPGRPVLPGAAAWGRAAPPALRKPVPLRAGGTGPWESQQQRQLASPRGRAPGSAVPAPCCSCSTAGPGAGKKPRAAAGSWQGRAAAPGSFVPCVATRGESAGSCWACVSAVSRSCCPWAPAGSCTAGI